MGDANRATPRDPKKLGKVIRGCELGECSALLAAMT